MIITCLSMIITSHVMIVTSRVMIVISRVIINASVCVKVSSALWMILFQYVKRLSFKGFEL